MSKNEVILSARNLNKNFGSLQVLKGLELEVRRGELISIVGASGAGKSTLLHILGTLDAPDDGELKIDGNVISTMQGNDLAKFRNDKIGFVFQFHNLLPEFTALENVCMPGYLGKRPTEEVEKRAKELLEYLNVSARSTHKPSELSGGVQQRVAVARALINSPSIIFADEPSGNLDSKNAKDLHELFFQLRDELNQTFVIVTHNEHLASLADRTLEIRDGVII